MHECGDLIDDAIWESTEDISSALASGHSTEQRVVQNEIGRSFKLSHKRETKLDTRLQRIDAAASCSSASASGVTTSFTSALHGPVPERQQSE